ncbi:MAG: L-seryl-tRNA(Sec) selenium transferase, partial [Deltaproteobacteria bacterium]
VMRKSGARLVEVGTTNRTHLKDYEADITPETALIMKVHRSNFDIVGFTADVPIRDLAKLGKNNNIPVMNDLGSGSLIDLSGYGIKREPTVQDSVEAGIDVITFSGDKLLGGPQAGIVIGKREIMSAVKKNPLTRALRIDKLTVAALEGTLKIYMDELKAVDEIPVLRMLTLPIADLTKTAGRLQKGIRAIQGGRFEAMIRDGFSQVGGGAMPLQEIPTKLVVIKAKGISANRLEKKLRANPIPIVARIERDEVVFDMRTLMGGDIEIITGFFKGASIE